MWTQKYKHLHSWKEVSRTFTDPPGSRVTINSAPPAMFERALHGFTNIELQCQTCGDVKVIQEIGKVEKNG